MGQSGKIRRFGIALLCLVVLLAAVVWGMERRLDEHMRRGPSEEKQTFTLLQGKEVYEASDYEFLLMQTGLGRSAVDKLRAQFGKNETGYLDALAGHQANFFAEPLINCRKIGFVTSEEKVVDEQGKQIAGFSFADLQTGDVLISSSTHTLGWRHGHAALVVDGREGITVESVIWGEPTTNQSVAKWERYPAVIQLRLTDSQEPVEYNGRTMTVAEAVVAFAEEEIQEVPYGLLAGVPIKAPDSLTKTHCSHLVWYPYNFFGYDIDSNGGWLVTPQDIASSGLFEVVQVYGFDPEELWR